MKLLIMCGNVFPSLSHQTPAILYKPCSLELSTHHYLWATEQLQSVDSPSDKVLPKHNTIAICPSLKIAHLIAKEYV